MLSENYISSLNNNYVTPGVVSECFHNDLFDVNTVFTGILYNKYLGQHSSDISSVTRSKSSHGPHDAHVETDASVHVSHNPPLYTVDIMNHCFQDTSDNTFNYLMFIHNNSQQVLKGFYLLKVNCLTGHMAVVDCQWHPVGPLEVCSTLQMCIQSHMHDALIRQRRLEANRAYSNFKQDCFAMERHGVSYQEYITNVIDSIIVSQNVNNECNRLDNTMDSQTMLEQNDAHSISDYQINTQRHTPKELENPVRGRVDINDPSKTKGYIALQSTQFQFIGPDRATEELSSVHQYLRIAKTIRESGLPNYKQATIPIKSGLNIDAWKRHLCDYPDKKLLQYLQYGFPLSLKNSHVLNNLSVKNHFSALAHPRAVESYLEKEKTEGAILGPIKNLGGDPEHVHIHCSPLLTRPKDIDKRRIILDLSFPNGQSLNDQVDREQFDNSKFLLKFPSIDDIVDEICRNNDDVTIAKIDVARAFRNLRVDPADALKLGIRWKDDAFIDVSAAFGWVHGSAAFQRCSDAVTFIMTRHKAKMFAYIDDYILVSPKATADAHFRRLASLLTDLGLPSNPDKQTPPSRTLTCLGIQIDLDLNTMSIDSEKLSSILTECMAIRNKKYLSRTAFQSLLGKLLYIHKCVRPARTFINRMLALFRANPGAKRIFLTTDFHKDLHWFLAFLPSLNGIAYIRKPEIVQAHSLHVDASLTGLGGIWNQEVYSTPIFDIYNHKLTIVHLEMLNLIIALKLWGHRWAHMTVRFYCDNLAVVQVVNTGKTRDEWLALCLRNIWLLIASYDITLKVDHIRGSVNNVADMLSRLYSDKITDFDLYKNIKDTCIWHKIPLQYFNLNYEI